MTIQAFEPIDPAVLCQKLTVDLASMGYSLVATDTESGFDLVAEKDRTPMDFVLGRQQKIVFSVRLRQNTSEDAKPYGVECISHRQARANRIFCLFFGAFLLGIPWIFCLIARSNAREVVEIGETSIRNVVVKQNAASVEAHSQTDGS